MRENFPMKDSIWPNQMNNTFMKINKFPFLSLLNTSKYNNARATRAIWIFHILMSLDKNRETSSELSDWDEENIQIVCTANNFVFLVLWRPIRHYMSTQHSAKCTNFLSGNANTIQKQTNAFALIFFFFSFLIFRFVLNSLKKFIQSMCCCCSIFC